MPNLYKKLTLFLLVVTLMLFGCSRKESTPPTTQKPDTSAVTDVTSYFPTEPNLTWKYEGQGNEYAAFTGRVLYKKDNLVQITENNGGTVVTMVFRESPDEIVKIYSEPEFYDDRNILDTKPNLHEVILKAPLKVGAQWQDEKYKREVISIDETIEVPAGKYDKVVKLKKTSLDDTKVEGENYEYYAKDIGLVMREFISTDMKVASRLKSLENK